MKIYLASNYGSRTEMQEYALILRERGFDITSRWLEGYHELQKSFREGAGAFNSWCATEDIEDIMAADVMVAFAGEGRRSRGGRHVEFGLALAMGKRIILVGKRENVFHYLPYVDYVPTSAMLFQKLADLMSPSGPEATEASHPLVASPPE